MIHPLNGRIGMYCHSMEHDGMVSTCIATVRVQPLLDEHSVMCASAYRSLFSFLCLLASLVHSIVASLAHVVGCLLNLVASLLALHMANESCRQGVISAGTKWGVHLTILHCIVSLMELPLLGNDVAFKRSTKVIERQPQSRD
jgi:hypothetical protein